MRLKFERMRSSWRCSCVVDYLKKIPESLKKKKKAQISGVK